MDETTTFLTSGKEDGALLPAINEHLAVAGLSITLEDAVMLAKQRAELLAKVERVEFGPPAIATIAEAVAASPFLMQDNVVDVLTELQEAFYALRNDLSIDIPDAEIVEALRGGFDTYEGDLTEVSAALDRAIRCGELHRCTRAHLPRLPRPPCEPLRFAAFARRGTDSRCF